jgi:hypothetical protein
MTEDPRCCGSGTCIIDPDGRCWCGQQWDGQKMCSPALPPAAANPPLPGDEPDAMDAPRQPGAAGTAGGLLLAVVLAWPLSAAWPTAARAQAQPAAPVPQAPLAPGQVALSPAEARAVQAVVQGQLLALAAGDAAKAYGYASAGIQRQFGDAAGFMAMVRTAYPMIIAPRSLAFRLPERTPAAVLQAVQLRDAEGRAWLATYQLEAQAGGGWRISGCIVTPDDQRLSA